MRLDTACENAENARPLSETQRIQARFCDLCDLCDLRVLRVSQRGAFATGCQTTLVYIARVWRLASLSRERTSP